MASVTEICSAALTRLSQDPITDLNEGSKWADLCRINWPLVRDAVLRSFEWPCAVRRATLSPQPQPPEWGYAFQFQLPADCLRLLETSLPDELFQVEGGMILTDSAVLGIRYIFRVEETGRYDSMLVEALVSAMVKVLSYPTSQSAAMFERAAADLKGTVQEAKASATTEKDKVDQDDGYSWLTTRN